MGLNGLLGIIQSISTLCIGIWAYVVRHTTSKCVHADKRTVYPKKYAHGFCFAVLCCGYTLTDFPISIRLTSLALRQSNDCPSASKATLMNMDKYFIWIHYERLYNNNKEKHNKTVCIFLGIYCMFINNMSHMWNIRVFVVHMTIPSDLRVHHKKNILFSVILLSHTLQWCG